ncbi:hypothetical protein BURPS668_A1538 [Burkholderia pseudomallei 668]|nr:hypothetical protein BURPS668_A1538 [Burkholderia pseudomallei 668]
MRLASPFAVVGTGGEYGRRKKRRSARRMPHGRLQRARMGRAHAARSCGDIVMIEYRDTRERIAPSAR